MVLGALAGVVIGLSAGLFLISSKVVTEPGFESVIVTQPPFLSPRVTGEVDGPGEHYHFKFAHGIPVQKQQTFVSKGILVFAQGYEQLGMDVEVAFEVADAPRLLITFGEDWYADYAENAVAAAVGLTGMNFPVGMIVLPSEFDRDRFQLAAKIQLQRFMINKGMPLIVRDIKVTKATPRAEKPAQ